MGEMEGDNLTLLQGTIRQNTRQMYFDINRLDIR